MKISYVFFLFVFLTNYFFASGQEQLYNLDYNPVLIHAKTQQTGTRDIVFSRDTLCLPFFDDFSNNNVFLDDTGLFCNDTVMNTSPSQIYPNALFWTDSTAFVNRTYPILPPSYGAVTLDGIDRYGRPHNILSDYGAADTLTSRHLYLGVSLVDTVYLSFYYQPKGFGDAPELSDSLLLEFKTASDQWVRVWHAVNTLGNSNQQFRIAMIPITDANYLYDGFQFRFRNKASVNGNNDHWNLDWIYLNEDRSYSDTLFRDVSYTGEPGKYLKRYRQMPWNQFKNYQEQELSDNMLLQLINNYNTIVNTSHNYTAYEKYTQAEIIEPTLPISINFEPLSTIFADYTTIGISSSTPGFDEDSLTAVFKYVLNPAGDVIRHNDTLYYEQQFYNYYAYDDGTAEKAYALNGIGSKLAIEYFANEPDTIKEVYIHWAYVDGSNSDLYFSLMIWDYIDTTLTSNGENIIYEADFLSPQYVDSINGWYVYQLVDFLGEPAPVVVDGYFYVGWLQTQSAFLNVGFDVNTVANENVFYNVGGNWQQSELAGSIMIRPQVGGNYSMYTGVTDKVMENSLVIGPNPVHDNLIIHSILPYGSVGKIYNLSGQIVKSFFTDLHTVDVNELAPGFYLLEITEPDTGNFRITKFIKQ